jgi:hypothetical protein
MTLKVISYIKGIRITGIHIVTVPIVEFGVEHMDTQEDLFAILVQERD